MRLELVKAPRGIAPATEQDEERLRLVRVGDLLPVVIRKPRNGKLHRKFFALVRFVAENHPGCRGNEDIARHALLCAAGHCNDYVSPDGEFIQIARSIRYDEVDDLEFRTVYDRAVKAAATELLPEGMPPHRLEHYLERVVQF